MTPTLALASELIRCPSLTPTDAGCQELLSSRLQKLGFSIERLPYDDVTNLWARHGTDAPLLCFAGHTDVVPTGPLSAWHSDPFKPEIRDGLLYGRGAADMKGGLAAMVIAAENFVAARPNHKGSIAFLITSDEEGPAINGTTKVVNLLKSRNEQIDWCLLGEPVSSAAVGDTIKNGRRGSLSGQLKVIGKQGHIAYPQLASNPLHSCINALNKLCTETWDQGNEFFPPTTMQISNMHMGTGADNVIPGELSVWFNFRFSTALNIATIKQRVTAILEQGSFAYELKWSLSGLPFLTAPGVLVDAARQAIQEITGLTTQLSTSGGTSDGRFIAPTGAQVLELGPVNTTIHQINECVGVAELETLTRIYQRVLELLLG